MLKIGRLGILFFLIHIFLFQLPSYGQNKKFFVITGKIIPEVETSETGMINISKGSTNSQINIAKNGKFRIELEYFNEYKLIFSLPGFFSKTIIVSTDIPQEVWSRDNDFPPFPMIVQLFKEIEGIDKSFTLKPSGRVFYGKKTDNFETESYFSDLQIGEQIETAKTQSGQVQKEVKTITKEEAQELAAKQKNFDQLVKEADLLFQRGEYQLALAKYLEAKKLFPEKSYANDRIAELQDLVKALEITQKQKAELEQKYKDAIARANGFFDQKTYKEARPVYVEALQYKPGDVYANGRIQEIDQLLALLEKQKQFDNLITQADNSYKSKNYDQAVLLYNQAKQVIPEKEYPQNQINLINQEKLQLAQLEQLEKDKNNKYQASIKLADQAFAVSDLEKAKINYQEALKIKPNEAYPTAQITKIDGLLAEKAKSQQIENEFLALVGKGDAAFDQKEYLTARTNYSSALVLKSNSVEVKTKIKNIDSILQKIADDKKKEDDRLQALAAAQEKAYTDAITQADKSFDKKDYIVAQTGYRQALTYKPSEAHPADRIKEIDQILEKEKQAKLLDDNYKSVISRADKAFGTENYAEARKIYTEALTIKPNEAYPTAQISKIDDLLAEKAKLQQIENEFLALVGKGDAAFDQKEYLTAKTNYSSALVLKPNSAEVKTKIKNIDSILQKIADDKKKEDDRLLALAAAQEKAYTDAITKGNKLFAQKTYAEARISFQEAKKLKPTEPLPDEMIAKIDALIAENERKLVEAGQKEALYASFIKEGETSFKNKDYSEARNSFVKASGLKPDEPIPVRRIQDIDKILSDIALADAKNKAAELAYQEAIKLADQAFKLDQLDEAGNKYQLALTSKPNDQYANTQLDEISKRRAAILAEKALLKKLDEQYDASIKMAQDAFQKNKLKEARDAYQKAMGIKPSEPVPPARIAEIDKMIAQLDEAAKLAAMKDEQRLAKEKANKEQYDKAIASGDQSFTEKRYKDSRAFYTDALSIFPNENYPKTQISKIDNLIAQQQKDELLARANAIKDSISKANGNAFDQAMASAKVLEQSKQYQNAILKYKEAITINPGERTNVQKLIISLEDQIRLMAKQESQYKQSIAKADQLYAGKKLPDALTEYSNAANIKPTEDYPKTQIAEIQKTISERNASYDNAIKNGDKAFNESDWQSAKAAYTEASLVKPDEAYPPKRLKETNQKINEEKLAGIKNANESAAYNDAIAKAEKAFADDQLINAKMQFKVALSLKPNESVPAQRIKEIDAMIDQRNKDLLAQSQRDIDEKYRQAISVADNAFREKTYSIARLRYQEAKLIKPNESYPKDQIALIDQLMNVAAPVETYIKKLPEANTAQPTVPKTSNSAESTKTSTSQAQSLNADNDYTEAIRKADQSFGIKDYTSARFYYYKASDIKPKEEYPIKQIELIRKLIDSQLSDLDRAGYEQAITKADEAFSKQEYMIAKHFYNKALEIKSWEKYPKDRIQEILALTNSLLSEKLEKEYRDLIAKGDEAYVEKDISLARFYYNKALVIKTGEDYPRIKLKDIQKQIDQDDLDKIKLEYNKLIELGDEAMQKENFSIARYNYTKALNLKTDEKYPKDQLKLIKEALEKQKKPSIGTKN